MKGGLEVTQVSENLSEPLATASGLGTRAVPGLGHGFDTRPNEFRR